MYSSRFLTSRHILLWRWLNYVVGNCFIFRRRCGVYEQETQASYRFIGFFFHEAGQTLRFLGQIMSIFLLCFMTVIRLACMMADKKYCPRNRASIVKIYAIVNPQLLFKQRTVHGGQCWSFDVLAIFHLPLCRRQICATKHAMQGGE
jgi:hypothetical protein